MCSHFLWLVSISFHLLHSRWAGLLEEIAERLRSSKALLQLWQRYKELYEQGCSSIQRQEEKADQLLKLACSKDIADEEVSDWIQECSVSEATAVTFMSKCWIFLFSRVQQIFFFMLWLLCLRRCSGPKLRCRPPCRFSMNWEISWNSRWTHQQLLPSSQITSLSPNGFLLWNKRLLDSSPLCR